MGGMCGALAAPSKQTWLIGEEVFNSGIYSCIRNLQNPKSATASEGQHPDTYHGNFWSNVGEPHCNSTVLSHWFYLLCMGSGELKTNDINNSYNFFGIGIDMAQQIVYKTETSYLYSSADYAAARDATIAASSSIYGANSYQTAAVTNAWYAVGVGSQYQYTFSGSSSICTQSTYTVNDMAPDDIVTWSVTPADIVSLQPNGNSLTVTKVWNGKITLTATINSNLAVSMPISVGVPYSLNISSYSNLTMLDETDFKILPSSGPYAYKGQLSLIDGIGLATSYNWSEVYNNASKPLYWWPDGTNNSKVDVATKYANTILALKCTTSNSCGSYSRYYTFTTGGASPLIITPNPSSNQTEVTIPNAETTNVMQTSALESTNTIYTIKLVNSFGITVYSASTAAKKFTIPTLSFRNGIYAVTVSDGINAYQNKLIVNH